MRTSVMIDDSLMTKAIKAGGYRTKKSVLEDGLRLVLQVNSQRKIHGLKGKIKWEGNLEQMRKD